VHRFNSIRLSRANLTSGAECSLIRSMVICCVVDGVRWVEREGEGGGGGGEETDEGRLLV
jgi:hypothetical protein